MTPAYRFFRVAVLLAVIAQGCRSEQDDRLPKSLEVHSLGFRHAFDKNWEVMLSVSNSANDSFTLQDLASEDARLELKDKARLSLHKLSVGKSKPLVVPAHSSKRTSLLFNSADSPPHTLVLKGRRIPIDAQ